MTIKKLLDEINIDVIRSESEVRTKIIYPLLLNILNYKRQNIVDEFPVYSTSGRKKNPTTYVDNMIFMSEGGNLHSEQTSSNIEWVHNNSLIVIELKKPKEKIENAKEQARFYAMWTRALIYIITNGTEIEVYSLKDHKADNLLFKGKIMELDKDWKQLYTSLSFSNLKRQKNNPSLPPKTITISSNYWEDISYEDERDITDAIKGNKLFPYNVKTCPELPIIKKLENNIEISNYCIIKGNSGCGKSITAYQLGYHYYQKGYKIFRYKNNDDEFDYNLKDLITEKAVFIIDDFQNLKNVSIDKILANTTKNLIIIITITDNVSIDAETTYLSVSQSIEYIYKYYLLNKKRIYKIVHSIDKTVGDTYPSETIESRLEKAYKEGNSSPWMFNYILRGGWNTAKNDYYQAKDNNRADLILLYISLKQISLLDKSVNIIELEKLLSIVDYNKKWLLSGIKTLVNKKIIIEENDCYRCAHIKYASLIVNKMSHELPKEEKNIIIEIIHQIILDNSSNMQGISWLLNEFRTHELLYYEENIITEKIWKHIKERVFSSKSDLDIRNACFALEISFRFYDSGKNEIIKEKTDLICNWINNINFTTGFALSQLINGLLDYKNKNNPSNLLFQRKINFIKIANIINNSDCKNLGAIGYFIERLFIFKGEDWKKELSNNINMASVITNIRKDIKNLDIWYLSHFITSLYYLNNDYGLNLYDKIEDIFANSIYNDCLETYESMNDCLLWEVFGFSPFNDKKPKATLIKRVKKLINNINTEDLAYKICNSNNHDWERYARLINLINIVDKTVSNKVLKNLDLNTLESNLEDYWETLPREMRYILLELAIASENFEPIKDLIEKNIKHIKFAEPVLTYICPKIINHCLLNELKIDIFGFNDSWENALGMLTIIEREYPTALETAISQSIDKISKEIQFIVPYSGFNDNYISELLDYLESKSPILMGKIFKNLDADKTVESLNRYYREKRKNKYANKTLYTICNYLNKYNSELKEFSTNMLEKIPARYKKEMHIN